MANNLPPAGYIAGILPDMQVAGFLNTSNAIRVTGS